MKIEVLYFSGCPNHEPAVGLVRKVVSDLGLGVQVDEVELRGGDDAQRARFFGSPTIRVNGVDVEPAARSRTDYGFTCRMYGRSGVPPRELIEVALRDAKQ
jgi:hypothetical protein